MGQIWDVLRSVSVHFGSTSQNVLKLTLKSPRFVPFGANLTRFGCHIWHPWWWEAEQTSQSNHVVIYQPIRRQCEVTWLSVSQSASRTGDNSRMTYEHDLQVAVSPWPAVIRANDVTVSITLAASDHCPCQADCCPGQYILTLPTAKQIQLAPFGECP